MIFSRFANAFDNGSKAVDTSWEEFVDSIGPHDFTIRDKNNCPAFSPARYPDGPWHRQGAQFRAQAKTKAFWCFDADQGKWVNNLGRRDHNHVVSVAFGVLDLDRVSAQQLLEVCEKLEGLNAFLYTTFSHPGEITTSGLWRARVCIEFSRPVLACDWSITWARLVRHFGGTSDPKDKDASRLYYGCFSPPGTEQYARFVRWNGKPLDVDSLQGGGDLVQASGTDIITRERLQRLAKRWKASRDDFRSTMGQALQELTQGEPFAKEGNVDNLIFQLCRDLAEAFPNADSKSLALHFAPSLPLMAYGGKAAHSIDQVEEKIQRALTTLAQTTADEEEAQAVEKRLYIRSAFANVDPSRDWPYTPEEIANLPKRFGCASDEIVKRWMIQKGSSYWVFGPEGYNARNYSEKDLRSGVLRDLAPATSAGVDLWTLGPSGDPVRKDIARLMSDYGTVALDYVLDLRAQETGYDAGQRLLTVAPCPLRRLEPGFDPEVHTWLGHLAGPALPDVYTWLANVTDLGNTACALMLLGTRGTGKSLFACGVARLWNTFQATPLESALAGFNSALAANPLVFGDEQLPKDFRGKGRTAELRAMLAARSRPYNRKFLDESVLIGAIRLIIAANNEDILAINENLSTSDVGAIAERFYRINIIGDEDSAPARDYLQGIDAESFVTQDRMARHCLWLGDNWPYTRQGRFLLQPKDGNFARSLTTRTGIRSAVCQFLCGYLVSRTRIDSQKKADLLVNAGRLLVNTKALVDNWELYVTNEAAPGTGALATAVKGLSLRRTTCNSRHYYEIDSEHLVAWAEATQFTSPEEIRASLVKASG